MEPASETDQTDETSSAVAVEDDATLLMPPTHVPAGTESLHPTDPADPTDPTDPTPDDQADQPVGETGPERVEKTGAETVEETDGAEDGDPTSPRSSAATRRRP